MDSNSMIFLRDNGKWIVSAFQEKQTNEFCIFTLYLNGIQ